jgi:uncharacterized protein with von Willebrand factor type A (vWA) domain
VLLGNLLAFGRLLRRLGLDVHPGRMFDVAEALQHVNIRTRDEVYHTCRALLVHRYEDLIIFDRAFDAFWRHDRAQRHVGGESVSSPRLEQNSSSAADVPHELQQTVTSQHAVVQNSSSTSDGADSSDDRSGNAEVTAWPFWSDAEILASKDFAEFTADDIDRARAALARLEWHPGERKTRRWVRGTGPRLDLRRALHESRRTGGDLVALPRRERRRRPRPIVLLCDVSGSMERYSRMLLHFAHAIGRRHRRVETFLFSTRLTRITTELRVRGLDQAVAAVSRAVPDWSGGTRIGDALRELHVQWKRRVLHGGPVVLLISDGWDCGDSVVLRDQMARLRRNCHRLIWLNPLIGTVGFAPLTRGLQAALPFVDDFLPARTLMNLADLAGHLNRLAPARGPR